MARILRRPLAKADLRDIFRFIAKDSPQAARSYLRDLDDAIRHVAVAPFIGSARLPTYPDMRVFPYRNHLRIYRPLIEGDGIEPFGCFMAHKTGRQRSTTSHERRGSNTLSRALRDAARQTMRRAAQSIRSSLGCGGVIPGR